MSSVPGDGARCVSQLRVAGSCNRIGRITRGGAPHWMMLRLLRMGLRVKLLAMGVMRGLLSSGGSVFYQGREIWKSGAQWRERGRNTRCNTRPFLRGAKVKLRGLKTCSVL